MNKEKLRKEFYDKFLPPEEPETEPICDFIHGQLVTAKHIADWWLSKFPDLSWQKGKKIGEISENRLKKLPEWKKDWQREAFADMGWEKEFDKKLPKGCLNCEPADRNFLKNIISSLLESQKKESYEEGRKAKGSSWREGYTQGRDEAKKEIAEEILKKLPNKQTHWLEHGDGSGHPHDTEYDFGWNSAIEKVQEIINKL